MPFADATPAVSGQRAYLSGFDGLRWLAAVHVVLFHTVHVDWLPAPALRPLTWGFTSTSLLFLLSGFVLAYTYAGPDGLLRIRAGEFWWRRVTRLLPLTLLGHLLTVPLVWSTYSGAERVPRVAATLLSVQAWFPDLATSFNSPGWSVSALLVWYALFPLILLAVRGWSTRGVLVGLAGVWLVAMLPVGAYLAWGGGDPYWHSAVNHHPLVRLPEFTFGVLLAVLLRGRWSPRAWMLPAGLAGWLAAVVLLPEALQLAAHNGLLAPLHGLVLLGVAAGGGRIGRLLSWGPLARAGPSGFAIFLLHVPIYSWLIMRNAAWLAASPTALRWSAYAVFLLLTISVSWATERWLLAGLTAWLRARTWSGAGRRPFGAVAGD